MNASATLSVGLTPCPNDTWMFDAVASGRLPFDAHLALDLQDIETLNERALARQYDIVKVSCALYGQLARDYALLDVGAAVAEGYGPLILTREPMTTKALVAARVVGPGAHTTGHALARLYAPGLRVTQLRYSEIMPAVARGEFDAGIVIHEGRLTFETYGLHCQVDLGAWWTATTGLPVALGCYLIRRELHATYARPFEALLRESLALARAKPEIGPFVRAHAQEMDEDVLRDYIALYVNERTTRLGADGREAITALGARLAAAHA